MYSVSSRNDTSFPELRTLCSHRGVSSLNFSLAIQETPRLFWVRETRFMPPSRGVEQNCLSKEHRRLRTDERCLHRDLFLPSLHRSRTKMRQARHQTSRLPTLPPSRQGYTCDSEVREVTFLSPSLGTFNLSFVREATLVGHFLKKTLLSRGGIFFFFPKKNPKNHQSGGIKGHGV